MSAALLAVALAWAPAAMAQPYFVPPAPSASPAPAPPANPLVPAPVPPATQPTGPAPDVWLPRGVADIQALDKINARVQTLPVKLGQTVTFGSLSLTLRACLVRPQDQPQDSAALLDIVDSHAEQTAFHGWMFASQPEVSMLESAVYDIRLNACHS